MITAPSSSENDGTSTAKRRESRTAAVISPAPTDLPTITLDALPSPTKKTKAMLSNVRIMVTAA